MMTTPNSLLNLVIQYVSQHLELVESFEGFPEIVGELIFRAAESNSKFDYHGDEYHECLRRLVLFTDAYGEVVLSKLSLTRRWSSLHLYKCHLQLFRDLTALELAECGLDDNDELLPHIGQHLHKLKCLSLQQNKLTDNGLVRMTTPYRVMGVGPGELESINISDNQEITGSGVLKYLSAFQDLVEINITGTSRNESLLKLWQFDIKKESSTSPDVINTGWAADVVDKWAVQAEQSLVMADKEKSTTQRFYSNKRKDEENYFKSKGTFKNTVSGYNIILSRIKNDGSKTTPENIVIHQRNDRISLPRCSSEFRGNNNIKEMDNSVITPGLSSDFGINDLEIIKEYGLKANKSDDLSTMSSSQSLAGQHMICREKTNSDLHVAKRRKVTVCRTEQTDTRDDYDKVECIDKDKKLSKDNCPERISNETEIEIQRPFKSTKTDKMTKSDIEIMMGYIGSKSVRTSDQKNSVMDSICGSENQMNNNKKRRFFQKGEAELMKTSTKDSVKYLKRKKSFWNHINSTT
ncbi:uncharacterized protein [Argopecten irradians]|uniref:uncharacterized protein isoform X2 n=1 Tax=Argopecten irradians TaxID=31199 RepID=UPI003721CEC8